MALYYPDITSDPHQVLCIPCTYEIRLPYGEHRVCGYPLLKGSGTTLCANHADLTKGQSLVLTINHFSSLFLGSNSDFLSFFSAGKQAASPTVLYARSARQGSDSVGKYRFASRWY